MPTEVEQKAIITQLLSIFGGKQGLVEWLGKNQLLIMPFNINTCVFGNDAKITDTKGAEPKKLPRHTSQLLLSECDPRKVPVIIDSVNKAKWMKSLVMDLPDPRMDVWNKSVLFALLACKMTHDRIAETLGVSKSLIYNRMKYYGVNMQKVKEELGIE